MPPPGLSNGHNKLASHPGLAKPGGLGGSIGLGPLDAPLLRDQTLTVNLPVSIDEKIGQARNWGDIADKFTIVSIEPPVAGGYFSINKAGELHVTRLGVLHLRRREYRLTVEADNVVGSGRAVITIKVV